MAIYGPWSAGWKPKGADVYRHYRSYLNYSSSASATSVTITANMGFNLDHTVSHSPYPSQLRIGGNTWTGSGASKFQDKKTYGVIGNHSATYSRTTSSYTVNVYADVRSKTSTGSGGWKNAWSTVGVSITVPALDQYVVSFVMNGHGTQVAAQAISYGYKATEPTIPVDNHYGFLGWYTDVACTIPYNFNNAVTSNIVLYAKWIKLYPTTRVKVNGVWYRGEFRCKMNNQICDVVDGFTKVNGVWVPINRS